MFKIYHFSTIILGIALSNNALAVDCIDSTKLNNTGLTSALNGNTVCVGSAPNWDGQEQHRSDSELWDYKHGPISASNLNDPTDKIGTWLISDDTVTYTYHGGDSFAYTLHTIDNVSYTFCGATNTDATIETGEVGCPP